jgi:precorrin-4 C11-methyltransferase
MKIAILVISECSIQKALTLQKELQDATIFSTLELKGSEHIASLTDFIAENGANYEAFIFFSAMGICVRSIQSIIKDKHTDPAVICIDSMAYFIIPVLSGHIGKANQLSKYVAAVLGGYAIVTTQSDNAGLWALDTFEDEFDWEAIPHGDATMNDIIAAFVKRVPTALILDVRDRGTEELEHTLPPHVDILPSFSGIDDGEHKLFIIVSPFSYKIPEDVLAIHFVPKVLNMGIGLAHNAGPMSIVLDDMINMWKSHGIIAKAIRQVATIDIKSEEPVIKVLEKAYSIKYFTAEELSKVDVPTPSGVVKKHVGTPSVCEAAAMLASEGGRLYMKKQKGDNFTMAIAMDLQHVRVGHVEIVGAGPGDPELISVRGMMMLQAADLILYAGSLVPKDFTAYTKPGATIRSSASMNLEEQCELMHDFYQRGKLIVRLHTGDPCIYGAIEEQMSYFDEHAMSYHITPGISSFQAAAAELKSQFTIPEKVQTVILTRGEGRTPMPDKEKLHLLARSQSTMCIFLSAGIAEEVQQELLQCYPPTTPVAVCYHLTWKDQRIYRGELQHLSDIIKGNNLSLTTMIVVGDAIDNRKGTSKLYDKDFNHLFRP